MRTRIAVFLSIFALLLHFSPVQAAGSDEAQGAAKFRDLPFSDTTDATAYTGNPGDPDVCRSGPSTNSVWYRFQPKADGLVTIDTFGSNYDTVLGVFTSSPGQSARDLSLVTCNDDVNISLRQSQVTFSAKRNVSYFIMVEPFFSRPAGTLVLNASAN